MSIVSIEARAIELQSLHKHDLARILAKAEAELRLIGHNVEALFLDDAPAPALPQGTDPDITDVDPASTTPEVLDLETLEPIAVATEEGADAAPATDTPTEGAPQ